MKRTVKKSNIHTNPVKSPAFPNAADENYFAGKALDLLTAIVSGMGLVSAMLFLVTLA